MDFQDIHLLSRKIINEKTSPIALAQDDEEVFDLEEDHLLEQHHVNHFLTTPQTTSLRTSNQ